MKKKKYLPLYFKWMRSGRLNDEGLCCNELGDNLKLFEPTEVDTARLIRAGHCHIFWGSGGGCNDPYIHGEEYDFTTLRQTIVLFLAAMNDEL